MRARVTTLCLGAALGAVAGVVVTTVVAVSLAFRWGAIEPWAALSAIKGTPR